MRLPSFLTSARYTEIAPPKYTEIPEKFLIVPKPTWMRSHWRLLALTLIIVLIFAPALTFMAIILSSDNGKSQAAPIHNTSSNDTGVLDTHPDVYSVDSSHQMTGCNVMYRLSEQQWIDQNMDTYLADWIAAHPECNNASGGWYSCYALTVGYGGFYCLIGTGNCNSEAYCSTANTQVYYTLTSISHLTALYNNLYEGLEYAFTQSLTALPSLTLGLGYKPSDDSFMKQQLINVIFGILDQWTKPVSLPLSVIKSVISEKVKSEPIGDFSNFATISEAVRDFWRSVLNGVDSSFQDILRNGTLFAAVVKNGPYLQNPSNYTSIPNVDATYLPSIIIKYANILLSQQGFTVLNGSDTPYNLGPANCLLDKEANNTWNSWLDPMTMTCWVWGIDGQYNEKDRQPFDKIAKFLFVDGNHGQPYTTPQEVVRESIECRDLAKADHSHSNSSLSPASTSALKYQPTGVDVLPCVYDFPVCHSSSDDGCSVIQGCSVPVSIISTFCLSFWDSWL